MQECLKGLMPDVIHIFESADFYIINIILLPLSWINGDGTWFAKLCVDQHLPLLAIGSCDRDSFVSRVGPVDVLMDPVHC